MVRPELEMMALQHDPKMPDGVEGSQKHPVESRELALCFRQLPKEKTKRPPSSSLPLLEDTANVAVRSVSGQRQLRSRQRMGERHCGSQSHPDGVGGGLHLSGPAKHLRISLESLCERAEGAGSSWEEPAIGVDHA